MNRVLHMYLAYGRTDIKYPLPSTCWNPVFAHIQFLLAYFFFLIFWLCRMWALSSPTRDRTASPALEVQNHNHWTTREVTLLAFWWSLCLRVSNDAMSILNIVWWTQGNYWQFLTRGRYKRSEVLGRFRALPSNIIFPRVLSNKAIHDKNN